MIMMNYSSFFIFVIIGILFTLCHGLNNIVDSNIDNVNELSSQSSLLTVSLSAVDKEESLLSNNHRQLWDTRKRRKEKQEKEKQEVDENNNDNNNENENENNNENENENKDNESFIEKQKRMIIDKENKALDQLEKEMNEAALIAGGIEILKLTRNHLKKKKLETRKRTFGTYLQNVIVKLQLNLKYAPTGLPDDKIWSFLIPKRHILHGSQVQGYHVLALHYLLEANNALSERPSYYDHTVYDNWIEQDIIRFHQQCAKRHGILLYDHHHHHNNNNNNTREEEEGTKANEGTVTELTWSALFNKNCNPAQWYDQDNEKDNDEGPLKKWKHVLPRRRKKWYPIIPYGTANHAVYALKYLLIHHNLYDINHLEDEVMDITCSKEFDIAYENIALFYQYIMAKQGLAPMDTEHFFNTDNTMMYPLIDERYWFLLTENVTIYPQQANNDWDSRFHVDALTSLLYQRGQQSWWWWFRNTHKYSKFMVSSVIDWQKKHEISPANGIVNVKTWTSLIHDDNNKNGDHDDDDESIVMAYQSNNEYVRASCLLVKHFFKMNGWGLKQLPQKYWD